MNCDKAMQAAVLALIICSNKIAKLIFIRRSRNILHHPGQIAFPGGRRDGSETLEQTALREAEEETGIDSNKVRLLGSLTSINIPHSGYCITPFVGFTEEMPAWKLQYEEVEELFEISVHHLLDPKNVLICDAHKENGWIRIPFYKWKNVKIWGATAMVLSELLEVYQSSLNNC